MFRYIIYGRIINSNIELPLREITCSMDSSEQITLFVDFNFKEIQVRDVINYVDTDEVYIVYFYDGVIYEISGINDVIKVSAKSFEHFFSTFFNIPFSVYFSIKNGILLHCSSVIYDKNVLFLSGDKGIGKSTISSFLCNKYGYSFFSDDTIYVDEHINIFGATEYVKITDETANFIDVSTINCTKNLIGKNYIKFKKDFSNCSFTKNKIFIKLNRTNNNTYIEQINDKNIINTIILSNIVGIKYFPTDLLYKVYNNKIIKNTINEYHFFELFVKNGLKEIGSIVEILNNLLNGV